MVERLTAATLAARVGFKKRDERLQCSQKNAEARGETEAAGAGEADGACKAETAGEVDTIGTTPSEKSTDHPSTTWIQSSCRELLVAQESESFERFVPISGLAPKY